MLHVLLPATLMYCSKEWLGSQDLIEDRVIRGILLVVLDLPSHRTALLHSSSSLASMHGLHC